MDNQERKLPVPTRGRARGRARVTPDQYKQPSLDTDSVTSEVASVVSEVPTITSEVSSVVSAATNVTQVSDATTTTTAVSATAASIGSAQTRDADIETCSQVSGGDQSKGLRVTLKAGFVKQGFGGEKFGVVTNYFHMNKTPNFQLYQYRVDFNPAEDGTLVKKCLLRSQENILGAYIFDGHMLYTTRILSKEKRSLSAVRQDTGVEFTLTIRFVGHVFTTSPTYLQFYNMVMRKCMTIIDMEELGRHFYNRHDAIKMPEDRLELWPGIITAIRNHEVGTLLCVEVTHKVLRMSSVLEMIQGIKGQCKNAQDFEKSVKKELVGTIVMTHYNRRTYRVDDVDFTVTPECEFRQQDGTLSKYSEYHLRRYGDVAEVRDPNQPMLVSFPRKKDVNKGITGKIYLIPSLCNPTGLTDAMRKNFQLMKRLSEHLHMGPHKRKQKLDEFISKIRSSPEVQKEFSNWDIDFHPEYVMATARKYPSEKVFMGPEGSEPTCGDKNADWSRALKGRGMLNPKEFGNWVLFVPDREFGEVDNLLRQLREAGRSINVNVVNPLTIMRYDSRRTTSVIRDYLNRKGEEVKFAFVILTNNNVIQYAEVKKLCILDFAIGCQCFLAKNMNSPKAKSKLASICTKVMIQITAKLGGVPWGVKIPVRKLMVLGFDVYHCSERKNYSAGALVGTTDQALTRYFSSVNFHKDKSELAKNLTSGLRKCLEAFRMSNNEALPERVVLFRDGVGEGQINYVLDNEIPQLQEAISKTYKEVEQELPRLAVVIVTKKINSRAFLAKSGTPTTFDNVPPGTVIDNTMTLPERYDYFLVSQSVNQGTVSPTNYNVVFDESGFTAEQMQKLSFKLCHLYYNWCGTVAVPAPCQYAHKLAYLTGIALNDEAPLTLASSLWYL